MISRRHRIVVRAAVLTGCLALAPGWGSGSQGPATAALRVRSADFPSGGDIPPRFTCDGGDVSPALDWGEPPKATQSFVLIADDPDAPGGTWVHWVLFDVPAGTRTLGREVPRDGQLANGARQGRNDFGRIGYGGPCPPAGQRHRYLFRLFALDTRLGLRPGATRSEIDRAAQGHVLARGEWMGRYARR